MDEMLIVRQLITIVFLVIAVCTPLVILFKSTIDFWRMKTARLYVIFKGLAALAIWFVFSWGTIFLLFGIVFGSAHTEYRMSHNGAPNPDGSDNPIVAVSFIVLIYLLAGGGLSYWMLRRLKIKAFLS